MGAVTSRHDGIPGTEKNCSCCEGFELDDFAQLQAKVSTVSMDKGEEGQL